MEELKFKRQTNFTGRNGYFKCSGLELLSIDYDNKIMLSPLTSRGDVGRCDITIPKEEIPHLIFLLQKFILDEPKPMLKFYEPDGDGPGLVLHIAPIKSESEINIGDSVIVPDPEEK